MRFRRLLALAPAVLLALAGASPAMAVDWNVDVTNYMFTPSERQIEVGDKVIWSFRDGGHTATSRPGQGERWDSDLQSGGATYEHTFTKPGRYQYFCRPHDSFMRGVIEVGDDAVSDTVDKFRSKRRGRSVTISFVLNEPARMTYRLKGPSRRTVKRARLETGDHRFKLSRLARGSYRGTLTLADDFDNEVTPRSSFVIR
jgi:plastocyanin